MTTTPLQNRRRKLGRHPLLRIGTRCHDIYLELQKKPWQTQAELQRTLDFNPNAMLQRLKAEGLIAQRSEQKGNRTIQQYALVDENLQGMARDKVAIRVTVFVNVYGEYSATAQVLNQLDTAHTGNPRAIASNDYTMAVPKPDEPYQTRELFSEGFGLHAPVSAKKSEVIDLEGDYVDITPTKKPE
jgi:hypothetical protein